MSTAKRSTANTLGAGKGSGWTFLSNHAHVLVCIARDPEARLRDIAALVGITERAVQNILTDLEVEGLVHRYREGRRNQYTLDLDQPMRHSLEAHCTVQQLVDWVTKKGPPRRRRS